MKQTKKAYSIAYLSMANKSFIEKGLIFMKMDSNTILITGGTSGIGFELAAQLLQLGNTVIITGRDQSKLDLSQKETVQTFTHFSVM